MSNFANSRHIDVQQRCLEYAQLKENYNQVNGYQNLFKGTPMNEDQVNMENMDLSLSFLDSFVDE